MILPIKMNRGMTESPYDIELSRTEFASMMNAGVQSVMRAYPTIPTVPSANAIGTRKKMSENAAIKPMREAYIDEFSNSAGSLIVRLADSGQPGR